MRRKAIEGGRRRAGIAALSARLGFWLAALALLAQSWALAASPSAHDARSAAAELTAVLGPHVFVCTQSDAPGAPPPAHDCDLCPLCQLGPAAAGLPAPEVAPTTAPTAAYVLVVEPLRPRVRPLRPPQTFALARGPPSTT